LKSTSPNRAPWVAIIGVRIGKVGPRFADDLGYGLCLRAHCFDVENEALKAAARSWLNELQRLGCRIDEVVIRRRQRLEQIVTSRCSALGDGVPGTWPAAQLPGPLAETPGTHFAVREPTTITLPPRSAQKSTRSQKYLARRARVKRAVRGLI